MRDLHADVLVVGGGPAGSTTAALLAGKGHDVLLLDRAFFPREKACAEYLGPGVVAVLDRLGVLARVRAAGAARPSGIRIHSGRRSFLLRYNADRSAPGAPGAALGITRPALDEILLDHARSSGARVCEGVLVTAVETDDGRVAGVRTRTGRLTARFVVAADGLRSTVSRSLDLDTPTLWPARIGLVARYAGVTGFDRHAQMHAGRGVYCGIAPVGGGLVNVGLVTPLRSRLTGEGVQALFDRRLARLPQVQAVLRRGRRVTPVHGVGPLVKRVRRTSGPGYLLVGDAAGFLDPFTGEGVFRALRGAELAAAAMDHALRTGISQPSGYAEARRAEFKDKERVCALVQLFLAARPLFDYAVARLERRPAAGTRLSRVLGDLEPAGQALRPGFLWQVLRP